MISVLIYSEPRYKVSRKVLREKTSDFLAQANLDDVEVSLSIVGTRKIKSLNKDYRHKDSITDVLSFPQESPRDPDGILRLGDVVICYPVAVDEARVENKMVDEKIWELIEHGLRHLLGEHHEED